MLVPYFSLLVVTFLVSTVHGAAVGGSGLEARNNNYYKNYKNPFITTCLTHYHQYTTVMTATKTWCTTVHTKHPMPKPTWIYAPTLPTPVNNWHHYDNHHKQPYVCYPVASGAGSYTHLLPDPTIIPTDPVGPTPVTDPFTDPVGPTPIPDPVTDPVGPTPVTDPVTDPVGPTPVTDPFTDPVGPTPVTDPVGPTPVTDPVGPTPVTDPFTDPVGPTPVTDPFTDPVGPTPITDVISTPTTDRTTFSPDPVTSPRVQSTPVLSVSSPAVTPARSPVSDFPTFTPTVYLTSYSPTIYLTPTVTVTDVTPTDQPTDVATTYTA